MLTFPAKGSVMAPEPVSLGYCPTEFSIYFKPGANISNHLSCSQNVWVQDSRGEVGLTSPPKEIFASHPYILDSVG